jgi:hypothetical protein
MTTFQKSKILLFTNLMEDCTTRSQLLCFTNETISCSRALAWLLDEAICQIIENFNLSSYINTWWLTYNGSLVVWVNPSVLGYPWWLYNTQKIPCSFRLISPADILSVITQLLQKFNLVNKLSYPPNTSFCTMPSGMCSPRRNNTDLPCILFYFLAVILGSQNYNFQIAVERQLVCTRKKL